MLTRTWGIWRTKVFRRRPATLWRIVRHPIQAWRVKATWYDSIGEDGKHHFWEYLG